MTNLFVNGVKKTGVNLFPAIRFFLYLLALGILSYGVFHFSEANKDLRVSMTEQSTYIMLLEENERNWKSQVSKILDSYPAFLCHNEPPK